MHVRKFFYLILIYLTFFISIIGYSQNGPGGIGNNSGASNLKVWLRADSINLNGSDVDTLFDLSGYGNHFQQTDATYQPLYNASYAGLNSQPVIDFDGNGQYLLDGDGDSSYVNGESSYTLFFIVESDVSPTDKGFFTTAFPTGNDDVLSLRYNQTGDNGGASNIITAPVGTGNIYESAGGTQSTNPQLISYSWNSGNMPELFIDGTEDSPTFANPIVGNVSGADSVILGKGTQDIGDSDGWDGRIAEFLFYNKDLNSAERTIVENYLSARYDLTISNDKFTTNPAGFIFDIIGIGTESDGSHKGSVSAGFIINEDNSTLDADGEYVFAAHDNTSNDIASIQTGPNVTTCGAEAAWARDWYLQKTGGSVDLRISFDMGDGIEGGGIPQDISNYRLLYKANAGDDYSIVTTASTGIQSGDQVYFEVTDANILDGFYTLGTVDQTNSPVEGSSSQTWYTLVSGDWGDYEIWTRDPSGALPDNPNNEIPDPSDNVVILSGKTVTAISDNYELNSINVEGRLYLDTTKGHDFTDINGNGRIYIEGDYFPAGDSTDFITEGLGEGTVVYSGNTSYSITSSRTFYNMEVIMDNLTDVVSLVADYQINGSLKVEKGELQINDDSNTSLITLDVFGNVDVDANGSITVGTADAYVDNTGGTYGDYHEGFHQIIVGGDFTNKGIVSLTNLAAPDYDVANMSTDLNGAVSLVFTGASNNSLTCENTTDLYNLVIDKGTSQTYELEVYAKDTSHFALFGDNSNDWQGAQANPETQKALWIKSGTMRLTGEIFIPSLTEGSRDFSIGEDARLLLDGPNVFIANTANELTTYTGLSHGSPNGVDNGQSSQGLYVLGKLQVDNGKYLLGEAEAINFRDEAAGVIMINGGEIEANQIGISSSAARGDFSYVQNGGTLKLTSDYTADGGNAILNLSTTDMSFTMSEGEIIIEGVSSHTTNGILIGSDVGNYNVTGGTIKVDYDSGGSTDFEISSTANFYNFEVDTNTHVLFQNALDISNNLTLRNGTQLDAAGNNLSIAGDFVLENGASYIHGNNTTTFSGDQSSDIDIESTTYTLPFYDLVIEKDQRSNPDLYWDLGINESAGRSIDTADAENTIIQIENELIINRGQFTIERYTVSLLGNVTVSDGKLVYNPSLPGRLTLEGPSVQTIIGSSLYTPTFGNIKLDNSNGASITTDIEMDNFILTKGILDIGTNRLTIDTNFVENGNSTPFGSSKMIQTSASHGARGLKLKMDGDYTGGGTVNFPVGSNGYWAECDVNIDGAVGSITGYLNVTPVNLYHPTRPVGGCESIEGYWKTSSSGLSGVNSGITYNFYSSYPDPPGGGTKESYLIDGLWDGDGNASSPGWIDFDDGEIDGFPEEADFTIGKNSCFNNIVAVHSVASGNWDDDAIWDPQAPRSFDYVYIHDNHTVSVTANGQDAGKLTVYSGGALDIGSYTGLTYNIVKGGGEIRISSNTIPTADFEDFHYNDTAIFEYYGGTYTIPTDFSTYPNLEITGTGAKTLPNQDVLVRKSLTIDDETLILNSGDDLFVNDTLFIDNAGVLEYPTNADPSAVTVFKSIDLSGNTAANTIQIQAAGSNSGNHNLYVWEDIITNASSVIDLYDADDNAVDLTFNGDGNSTVNDGGSAIDLNRLIIDKSVSTADVNFNEAFTLNGPTNGTSTEKALYLINGDLTINDAGTDIYLTSGGGDFKIPSTSSLSVSNATVKAAGSNTGIYLDGYMQVGNNSNWLLNEGTNNYIEYSASGNAEIDVYQGTLSVGSQIRRNTLTTDGILKFSQNHKNSTVVLGEVDAPEGSRGVLEILNTGSEFTQVDSANITIVRGQTAASTPTVYLEPETVTLGAGSSITIGDDANTPAGETIGINSKVNLKNIIVNATNNPTAQLQIRGLTLEEDLNIETGASFDANGLDLNIQGDFINSGTYSAGVNTTTFNGTSKQQIIGNTTFYNLTKPNSNILCLNGTTSSDIDIDNNFRIEDGTFRDSSNVITVQGDLYNDGTHEYGGSGNGIELNGTNPQDITGSGSGIIGYLTVNNASGVGVQVTTGSQVVITDGLKLDGGVLDVGSNLLELRESADVIAGQPFSSTNMIQTNISFTDNGVKKIFPSGASTFLLPIGSEGKYTPVDYTITANGNSTGWITTKAADERHPSIQEDSESPDPEIVDEDNVLKYHWVLRANGITGFSGTIDMQYVSSDVYVTSPYDITDYITARLLSDESGLWSKYSTDKFDESNNLLIFDFDGNSDSEISGDYTAGVDGASFKGAIPDSVPFYETNTDGEWTDGSIWTPNVTGGPRGAIVRINTGDTVTMPSNYQSSYTTEINGTLKVDSTFGHRLGEVTGTGTLYTKRASLPAGYYEEFFADTGGTLEYGGADNYDVLSKFTQVNNLTFSGTGERRFPNQNITILGDFTINGEDANLQAINDHDEKITIGGDIYFNTGSFDAGSGSNAIVEMESSSAQTINGDFTGSNAFYYFEVNNSAGVILNGSIDIDADLTFTSGIITSSAANILTLTDKDGVVNNYGDNNYVDGPMRKNIVNGGGFTFPVGDDGRYGQAVIASTETSGPQYWEAEYYNDNPHNHVTPDLDTSKREGTLEMVSGNEYWRIKGPADDSATNQVRWDSYSLLPAMTDDRENNIKMVEWITANDQWEIVDPATVVDNGVNDGTITSDNLLALGGDHYFTLGTTEGAPLPAAGFLTEDTSVCDGSTVDLRVQLSGGDSPWTIYVWDDNNATTITESAINMEEYTFTVGPLSVTTTYTIDSVSDNNGVTTSATIFGDPVTVTVNPLPTDYNFVGGDTSICSSDSVELLLENSETDVNYELLENSGATGITVGGTGDTISFGYFNKVGSNTYTLDAVNQNTGCTRSFSTSKTISVTQSPDPEPYTDTNPICYDSGIDIPLYSNDINGVTVNSYSWTPVDSLDNASAENPNYQPSANPNAVSVSTMFYITIQSTDGCVASDSLEIELLRKPETGNQYYVPNEFDQ